VSLIAARAAGLACLAWALGALGGAPEEPSARHLDGPMRLLPRAGADLFLDASRDTDGFSAVHSRAGLLWRHESINRFSGVHVGADNFRQHGWSRHGVSLLGVYRDVERETGEGLSLQAGMSRLGDDLRAVGELTWNKRFSAATGMELLGNRSFVETRLGLEQATMSNFLAISGDHTIGDRLTLAGLAGVQAYSDNNTRAHLRARGIWLLVPEQGFAVEARVRAYDSSRPGRAAYFNPERYLRGEVGLRLRRSIGDWRVLAEAGAGSEDISDSARKGTGYATLRLQRSFANDMTFAILMTSQRSSEGDAASSADGKYRWEYLRALLLVPF
jgi:hypothetical protein